MRIRWWFTAPSAREKRTFWKASTSGYADVGPIFGLSSLPLKSLPIALSQRCTRVSNRRFANNFANAMRFLLDDLNFLATRKATQLEFLHSFDAVLAEGCQVVVSMDSHPRLCEELMPELIDRLLGGAIWSLLPPDRDTRLALLRAKSAVGAPIPDDVLKFLADHLRGNVRELEGAIHSLRHFGRVTGRKIDQSLAREAWEDSCATRFEWWGLRISIPPSARFFGSRREHCDRKHGPGRSVTRGMMAIYLCRKHTAATFGEISIYFGNKTHSTAVAAEKKVKEWLAKDVTLKAGDRQWRSSRID